MYAYSCELLIRTWELCGFTPLHKKNSKFISSSGYNTFKVCYVYKAHLRRPTPT